MRRSRTGNERPERPHERRDPRRGAAPGAARHHEEVPGRARQRPGELRGGAGRDPRAARRERRRQVHPGQDHLRRAARRRGHHAVAGRAGAGCRPACRARPRHRHGVPALLAVRGDDGAGEHRARRRRCRRHAQAGSPHRGGLARLRPAARSGARGAHALGRRAPADRDRPLPAAEPEASDHGRADLGADAAGGRAAVRDPAPACRRGLLDPLHQPQAARDQGAVRLRHDPARRQGRGDLRSQGRDRQKHGAADDRRARCARSRGARARPAASPGSWCATSTCRQTGRSARR